MSCPITLAGILSECNGQGGAMKLYMIDSEKIDATTIDPLTEIVTALTTEGEAKFVEYNIRKQTANFTSTVTSNDAAGTTFVETVLNATFPKMTAAKRLELKALSLGTLAVIVQDNNGVYWYLGYKYPVTLTTGTGATGTAFADANQFSITLTHTSDVLPFEISADAVASVI